MVGFWIGDCGGFEVQEREGGCELHDVNVDGGFLEGKKFWQLRVGWTEFIFSVDMRCWWR